MFEGWYLGGTLGGATVNYDFSPATGGVHTSGILGGAVGGYSLQSGPFVIGIEGDVLAADISGGRNFNAGLNKVSPSIDTMADLRLRAGYTITPHVLLFGTFGGAWANADLPVTGPGGASRERRFLRLERWRRRRGLAQSELGARFDYQFTDFESETVKYPGGKIDLRPGRQYLPRLADLPLLSCGSPQALF